MRICHVTSADPDQGVTGVAAYVRDLAHALAGAGHEVGHVYRTPGPAVAGVSSVRWTVRRGCRYAAVSANDAGDGSPASRFEGDVRGGPALNAWLAAVEGIHPDVVHVHDLSGVPADIIPACCARAYPVIVTLHDFWAFCRRLLLVRQDLTPCDGPDGGRNCARYCAGEPRPTRRMLTRLLIQTGPLSRPLRMARRAYRRVRGARASQFVVRRGTGSAGATGDAITAYASRQALMRDALLAATCLLAPSEDTRAQYERQGYPRGRIRVLPLSLLFEGRARGPRGFRGYPVRFGYMGRVNAWKGAHVLAEAAAEIPADRAHVTFYGAVEPEDERYLTVLAGGGGRVSFSGRYTRAQLAEIVEEIDVAVFPSIMRETQGLVGLEAQIAGLPVIAAAGGAIPEYVHHDVNGLLFTPGSASGLREQLRRVVDEPEMIGRLSANVRPPRRMDWHLAEILPIYEAAVSGERQAVSSR